MARPRTVLLVALIAASPFLAAIRLGAAEHQRVGNRVCLFLDDRFAAEQSGLKRVWHAGQPRAEVAIRGEHDWEQWPHIFGTVLHDPHDALYKMYYTATNHPSLNPPSSFTSYIAYAESVDGIRWTKPLLRLHEHKRSKENNIVIKYAELANIFLDPRETDARRRLKMFVYLHGGNPHGGLGESLLASGDGLEWSFVGNYSKPDYADPAYAEYTDTHFFTYDPLADRYLSYVRTWAKGRIAERADGRRRAAGISQSQEINRNYSPIEHVLATDDADDALAATFGQDPNKPDWAEIYCLPFFTYGNHYLGPMTLFFLLDGIDTGGAADIQLTFSHDGLRWTRPSERASLIAPSNAAGLFPTYSAGAPLEIGDELWMYYTEANGAHPLQPFKNSVSQIRAAVWRRDGFVSLDAAGDGALTTPPLQLDGACLIVNGRTDTDGAIRVALLDADGQPLEGFDTANCDPLQGDDTRRLVTWKKSGDLSSLRGRPVRLRFELSQASLFSFRFAPELPTRVVCLGDSVTKAAGVAPAQRFAALAESRLRAAGHEVTVLNAGVGSDTTTGGLKRLDADVLAKKPQIAVVMFGLNDSFSTAAGKPPLVALADYTENLRVLVRRLREANIRPVLMTPNPFTTPASDAAMQPYLAACRAVAKETQSPCIDIHAHFTKLYAASPPPSLNTDDCHLNPQGNAVIADLVVEGLKAVLSGKP